VRLLGVASSQPARVAKLEQHRLLDLVAIAISGVAISGVDHVGDRRAQLELDLGPLAFGQQAGHRPDVAVGACRHHLLLMIDRTMSSRADHSAAMPASTSRPSSVTR
jgi:hypothetical protein